MSNVFQINKINLENINEIEFNQFANKSIFTTIDWIKFLLSSNSGELLLLRITNSGILVGYFTGIIIRKFGIPILGSPFRGWSTCYMGFDINEPEKYLVPHLLIEIKNYIFKYTKCVYIEIIDRNLTLNSLSESFHLRTIESLELSIDNKTHEEIFSNFKGDCRTFIKQFETRGATIEIAQPDHIFAEEYYMQLIDVFYKQGLKPTYDLSKVNILLNTLSQTDKLLCLRVRDPNGKSIASSIFIGYNKTFFFWGGASFQDYQYYRPNEYMIWFALKFWRNLGFSKFDMVGVRKYKYKFGASIIEYPHIIITKYKFLIKFRDMAEKIFFILKKKKSKKTNTVVKNGNLVINKVFDKEISHYFNNEFDIKSKFNKIEIRFNETFSQIVLPTTIFQKLLGTNRLSRRLFRLDKSNVIPSYNGYIAFWQGNVYHIDSISKKCNKVLKLTGCRNPLHNSIAKVNDKVFFFGEYGQPNENGKSVYKTINGGKSWMNVYNISCNKIRHIHACKWDPFEEKIWVFTGDFEGQSYVLCSDLNFENIEWIGDGGQKFRAVDAIFEKDEIHWIMDSPLQSVNHIKLIRKTRQIEIGQRFPGPVWYLKKLQDGIALACSVQEVGPSHTDELIHLYATRNYKKWVEVATFEHDGFKKGLFKFGVGAFAEGEQFSNSFYMHFEAVKKLDGKVILCSLTGI